MHTLSDDSDIDGNNVSTSPNEGKYDLRCCCSLSIRQMFQAATLKMRDQMRGANAIALLVQHGEDKLNVAKECLSKMLDALPEHACIPLLVMFMGESGMFEITKILVFASEKAKG